MMDEIPNLINSVSDLLYYEREALSRGYRVICGIDEAGRGPLAGPVVACALVADCERPVEGVNDSKKLAPKKRAVLYRILTSNAKFGVGVVSEAEIDEINILRATIKAMRLALDDLAIRPDILFVDGMDLKMVSVFCRKIIKGDAKSYSIAAASIIAKVVRDKIMDRYHERYPQYCFAKNRGYGTKEHVAAIMKYGPSPVHRRSFEPVKSILSS